MNEKVKKNVSLIKQIYELVNNNLQEVADHRIHNPIPCDENTVTIVMTTHNRITQTLFTLNTINQSSYKNVQVILVDDSNKHIDGNSFKPYHFQIDHIIIKASKKWINPCINYNIGFKYIKGQHIIIQNSEVCHVGDVIQFVKDNLRPSQYIVFDVFNTGSHTNNNTLYNLCKNKALDYNTYKEFKSKAPTHIHWYQHTKHRPVDLHFLTAIHISKLKELNMCFDYDFSLGRWYDDNEFHYRIKNIIKLTIINIENEKQCLLGIHQHHDRPIIDAQYQETINFNHHIYFMKKNHYEKTGKWLELS